MSKLKHTPGPWRFGRGYRDKVEIDAPNGDGSIGLRSWKNLATVYGDSFDEGKNAQGRANARLIAAAPDMLEALETVFSVIEGAEGATMATDGELLRWEVIEKAIKNAIAKAKGGRDE
jgi:hypothetical protein